MSTKMKGLLKGLRYISQIFDEEKEQDMQIGFPTDVKHVAHIGWDGPSVDSPSWMKEFKNPTSFQSAPLGPHGDHKENPEIKWVSEDGKSGRMNKDQSEGGKSSRRHSSAENSSDSPKKERSRNSRKHQSKDSSDSVKSNRSLGSDSPARDLPDIPKKCRRKKSKDCMNGGGSGSVRSRMRGGREGSSSTSEACSTNSGLFKSKKNDEHSQSSSLKSDIEEEEKEISGIF